MKASITLLSMTKILTDTFHAFPVAGRELSMDGSALPYSSPIRLAISMAVAAASLPLFPALVPARSMAC